jgi:serine/threonine-protein kinase
MDRIAATHHDLGKLGDAVVHDALGRGHLALHEWREAADELALAEAAGRQTPELHAALGRALGELYRRALEEARRSGDKAWLARRQQELARQYLTPALVELEQSRASGEDAALLEARIAFYRHDFAAAEQQALAVAEHAPGLPDARKLAADAAYGAAIAVFDHGDYDAARPGLERAAALYAEASEIARSDASVYQAAAEAWLQRAEIDFRQGREPREPLERALEAIDRALGADPDDAPAYTAKAQVLLRWFRTPSLRGLGDQRPLLDRIAQAAARAVEIDPRNARAWDGLGIAHLFRGVYESSHGGQGAPWWNRTLEEVGKALAIQPDDPWANNDLGAAHRWLGASLDATGRDPMPEYQAALRSFERATTIDPQYVYAWSNQADIYTSIAEHDVALGIDPRPAVESARRAGERCLAVDPNYYSVLDTLAQAQLAIAHYLVGTGGDPAAALASARGYLDRAETVQPGNMVTWYYRIVAAGAEATFRLRQGADPTRSVAVGRAALNEALRLAPDSAVSYVEAARLDLVEAAWAGNAGSRLALLLAQARANAEKAVALDHQLAEAKLVAAEVHLQIATMQPSRAVVDRGIAHVDQALALNRRLPRAQTVRAALLRLRAP